MATLKSGILRGFDPVAHTATVEVTGSGKVYLEDVAVARNIPSAEMVTGHKLMVVFLDEHNARDAVVIAVW